MNGGKCIHKLQNQNFTEAEILESGLCIKTEKEGTKHDL
jgi:hypothetical protein